QPLHPRDCSMRARRDPRPSLRSFRRIAQKTAQRRRRTRTITITAGVAVCLLVAGQLRAASGTDPVNMVPAYGRPPSATSPPSGAAEVAKSSNLNAPGGPAVKAGVGVVDATWHVGASAGQYATDRMDPTNPNT